MPTKRLDPGRRAAARWPARVGFATEIVNGRDICPRRVIALDAENRVVGRKSLPGCK